MRLIVVDGLDGSGKDTQARKMKEWLEAHGEMVVLRSHPEDDNPWGRRAKRALKKTGKGAKLKASVYYALDVLRSVRRHCKRKKGGVVIMVRYLVGTAYLPDLPASLLYRFFHAILPTSKEMFFIDVTPEKMLERIKQRGEETEMFENLEALEQVRSRALGLIGIEWHIIDGNGTVGEVWAQMERVVNGDCAR
ncbi:MAG: thymidylate kinase [Candidatus Thermoplasmatota archaeon]|nr:thymidylate kinase [Candidatus Thermoplasmatota archaeon]